MARVKIEVAGDSTNFHKTMSGVESRLVGLKSKVGLSFGSALAGLAGGATITAMVNNMANFAAEIKHVSDNLNVTTKTMQQLRQVARQGGKDMEIWTSIQTHVEKFATAAQTPGSKEANVASRLGLSDKDLQSKHWFHLLQQGLTNSPASRATAEGLFNSMVGGKGNAGFVLGQKQNILNPSANGLVSDEDIDKMAELKEGFEDLIDVIRAALIPVLNNVVEWFTTLIKDSGIGEGLDFIFRRMSGESKLGPDALNKAGASSQFLTATAGKDLRNMSPEQFRQQLIKEQAVWGVGFGGQKTMRDVNPWAKNVPSLEGKSWSEVTPFLNKFMQPVADVTNKAAQQSVADFAELEKRSNERRANRKKSQAEMELDNAGREPATKADPRAFKSLLGLETKSGDAMLRVGGLMTKDTTYNLSRLTEQTNKILMDIYKVMLKQYGEDNPDSNQNQYGENM